MDLTDASLIFLLREYHECSTALDYGFDPETNDYRNEIIDELVYRTTGTRPEADEDFDPDNQ